MCGNRPSSMRSRGSPTAMPMYHSDTMDPVRSQCPSEHVIAAFAEGRLRGSEAEPIEVHLDTCGDCARLVADFARVYSDREREREESAVTDASTRAEEPQAARSKSEDAAVLRAGSIVGRYRVLECVGIGGM